MKRFFDFTIALLGLIIMMPLFLILAIVIWISMGRPIFFRQIRVGRFGKEFRIIKFRTMVNDAGRNGLDITSSDDPRLTPVGQFLRRYKFDEIPQLFNVLAGEMSLVGPRPEVPRYVALYSAYQRRVLDFRPGITDLATLTYRHEEKVLAKFEDRHRAYIDEIMPDKLRLNLEYIEQRTFFSDLGVIARTFIDIFKSY